MNKYIMKFENFSSHSGNFIEYYLNNGFTDEMIGMMMAEDYFDLVEMDNGNLIVYRKIAIKKDRYTSFKESLNSTTDLGVFWSLHNFMENLPYGHDEYNNTPENTYLIQLKGIVNIDTDINWEKMVELFDYDTDNFIIEGEIALNKIHVVEMFNEDTDEKIDLDIRYNIDYKLN